MREAVVLAGGYGTRLRELVADVPKPMAPIRGRPFLEVQLSLLAANRFDHVVLAVGYMGEKIIAHFGRQFRGVDISYTVEDVPLGTGGAIEAALRRCHGDGVFVMNGDTYLDLDYDTVHRLWHRSRRGVIVGRRVLDTARYGRLIVEDGLAWAMSEKGTGGPGIINAGCYVLNRNQMTDARLEAPFSFETDFLMRHLPIAPLDLFITDGLFIDIGVPEDFHRAQDLLAER